VGNDHHSLTPYEPFPVRDGLVMVAVGNPRLWTQFCRAIGAEDLEPDPRFATNTARMAHRAELKHELGLRLARFTRDEIIDRLRGYTVPCAQVRTVAEALEDPQLRAREMVVDMRHPDLGTVQTLGNPIKLSRTPAVIRRPPPRLGEHQGELIH
jgi:crotonobetainyl-CoA:carnitine CoA-transferase CaiB-like acyl-CoA transferase